MYKILFTLTLKFYSLHQWCNG